MNNNLSAVEIKKIVRKARMYPVVELPESIIFSERLIKGLRFVQSLSCNLLDQKATVSAMRCNGYPREARDLSSMSNSKYQSFLETQFSKQSRRVPV
ncbi:hypothetical protein [Mastigocoleus testarum]|uniref:Uncharacterized protein n=1 Tax=Mastigocoleus testarum BC008 TaxID=371196 RepID=A0A0V7ZGA5_9CYAN|nr:hypothetical protein [Mastigocoleus testarum]KST63528.1 hypothetical protein BC008_13775 [Mastigocoleus testarum BC008]